MSAGIKREGCPAPVEAWVAEPPDPEVARALDRLARTADVVRLAVLPDVHLAKEVCVGVAVATDSLLFPGAVGGDIGCGMAALRFDCGSDLLSERKAVARLMAELYERVPITRHHGTREAPVLADRPLSAPALEKRRRKEGVQQMGTLGRGNHFIEFQADEQERLWLMVHSGSRAMGQAIQAHHLKGAETTATGIGYLPATEPRGQAYLNDMLWALDYARENRRAMVDTIAALMAERFGVAADTASFVSCHHNFVAREEVAGRKLWVHRKGVISAREGEPGLVPGSMGTASYHVEGRGSAGSLCSSSHGAGRAMSRGEAKRRISVRALEKQMRDVWYDHRMAPRLVDEAPGAYKDITAVMRAQTALTRVVRKLRPLLSFKGG